MIRPITRRSLLATLAAAAVLPAAAARAHHGWSGYVAERLTILKGPIRAVRFQNPHCEIDLAAEGKVWRITLAPPFRMNARGVPDGTLQAGQELEIQGYLNRSDQTEIRAERIVLAGRAVEMR
jgi:hypothetical protein